MSNFCALPTYGLIISKRITLYSTILSHFYEDSIVLEITVTEDDCLGGKSLQELLLGTTMGLATKRPARKKASGKKALGKKALGKKALGKKALNQKSLQQKGLLL